MDENKELEVLEVIEIEECGDKVVFLDIEIEELIADEDFLAEANKGSCKASGH